MRLGGKAVEGTVMAASLMLVRDQVPDSNPAKKVAQSYIAAYEKMYASRPATFGANVYDAGLLLQAAVPEAAKKARPGTPEFRAALRDPLEQIKELAGMQSVYTMTRQDHFRVRSPRPRADAVAQRSLAAALGVAGQPVRRPPQRQALERMSWVGERLLSRPL